MNLSKSYQNMNGATDRGSDIDDRHNTAMDEIGADMLIVETDFNAHTADTAEHGATGAVVGTTNTQTLTNKTLTSPKINEDVAVTASATEINVLDGIPATLTATELGYSDGVTSAIQTQLNAKVPITKVAVSTALMTEVAVGFTLEGGTTKKTLTVPLDASVSGTNSGDNAANTSIAATKLDDFATPDNNTDLNANTTNHGLLLQATAPAAGLTNVVAIENGETVYKNKALFDATVPETQAYGDAAAVGSAVVAARRDHKHAMPAIAPAETATTIGALIGGADDATPNDTDFVATSLTAAGILKKITWTNVKAFLKTYFDTLYLGLAGGTMTGDIQLGETDIKLDAVLSGDETWSGVVIAGTAGSTIAVGEVCFLAADGKWDKVDGILDGTDTGFSRKLGMCVLAAGADTNPTEMLLIGKIRSAILPAGLTPGAPIYLADTAGTVVEAQPSTTNFAIRVVGFADTAEDLYFDPSDDYSVHI